MDRPERGVATSPADVCCHFCICTLLMVQPKGHRSKWKLPLSRQSAVRLGRSQSSSLISSNAEGEDEDEEEEEEGADAAWAWLSAPTLRDLKPQRLLKKRLTSVSSSAATCGFDIAL